LADALAMDSGFRDTIQETGIPNLFFIPGGQTFRDATELLASPALDHWMREFRSEFDIILVDTPPATDFADAKVWVRVSDGVLFTVRAGKVKSKVLLRVKSDFEDVGARILGVILNDAERDRIYGHAVEELKI
jgi:Mrp family chromosome partitioning ATPase